MYMEMIFGSLAGFLGGGAAVYFLQRKRRERELKRLYALAEDILNERRISAADSGQETLYGKTAHRLVRVQEMMQGSRDEARRSRDEIQRLISEIAHQMRTPLTNLETYLGFLRETAKEPGMGEISGSVRAAEESAGKLHFLVESFIRMSRLEQHIIQIKKEETDILKTVRNALGQIQCRAEEKELLVSVDFPGQVSLAHDANWLGEALFNIFDNAVKYSRNGGAINVSVTENEMFLKIRVRDYGIGIDAGEECQIFRRFYRGRRVTSQEGFGIGLYLAREIVNMHGGFLAVKRREPGVVMEVNLPVDFS